MTGHAETILQVLEERARNAPEQIAFTFHNEPACRYDELWKRIRQCAAYVIHQGLKGRVIVAVPNSREFFYGFYGLQLAGVVPVPVFPGSGAERIQRLATLCKADSVLLSKKNRAATPYKTISGLKLFLVEDSQGIEPSACWFPDISAADVAFIQFTSGSVSQSKGVQISHRNLMTNLQQMIRGFGISKVDVFLSWLPVFHDMGLVLMTMVPMYLGIPLLLLPTGLNYLKSWLRKISEHKVSFTAAPDFAYRLSLVYTRNPGEYDLSSLRVALNAAEPVRAGTINRFQSLFKLRNVMLPAYGLAEATVGVCGWQPGTGVKVDSRGCVSVGKPFPGVQMRIYKDNQPADVNDLGEIYVKSDANTIGYFNNPEATRQLVTEEGFIKTGDLGYMDEEGDFFIVGRKKNIIIHSGFNLSPREVEEVTDSCTSVRRSTAVGIDRGGLEGEQVYIFAEVRLSKNQSKDEDAYAVIHRRIVNKFDRVFGFRPGRVYLLKPGSIPMTQNGKIKYPLLKELYKGKKLHEKILFPDY